MKDHYKLLEPVNKSTLPLCPPCSPLLSPLEISDVKEQMNFQPDIFGGPLTERRYLLPMQMDSNSKDPKEAHCSTTECLSPLACCLPLGVDVLPRLDQE